MRGLIVMTAFAAVGCGAAVLAPFRDARATETIVSSLPPGWSLAEVKADQIPYGHFLGGHGGELLQLVGPRDVFLRWLDGTGRWRDDPVLRESLDIWIMPGSYRDSWRSWFDPHRPVPAALVYSGADIRVYGIASHRVKSDATFREVLEQAQATSAPEAAPSWASWKSDLQRALATKLER